MNPLLQDVGVVVIARNEGTRLLECLESLQESVRAVVYADSCSTDGSPERVRARGVPVVVLDPARRMNAARGRNAGFARLLELHPELRYVFFVDGDCRVVPGFLETARQALEAEPGLGAVCGRRRELAPEASFYNRVVDSEWNTPVGAAEAFGGDVLMRVRAFREAGGYREVLNQGEDPELAFRIRGAGWGIARIAHDMTLHDVALRSLGAWRRRHQRGGYAYAHSAVLHRRTPGRYNRRALLSILAWGLALPLGALGAAPATGGASLALLAAYGVLWLRIRAYRIRLGDAPGHASRYAALIAVGKIDEALGAVRCLWDLARGLETRTLEYKEPTAPAARRAA